MQTVADHLDRHPVVTERHTGETGFPVVKLGHPVEDIGTAQGTGIDTAVSLFFGGDAVAHGRDHIVLPQQFHQFIGMLQFGRKGHDPDLSAPRLQDLPGEPEVDRFQNCGGIL